MFRLRTALGSACLLALLPLGAAAQQDLSYPPNAYYLGFSPYHAGDYGGALRVFQSSFRSGVRSTEGRWVDSICYYTMMGECYYQMGQVTQALEQYESAIKLAIFHTNWLLRIEFPELEPSASTVRSTINWGVSKRATGLARIRDRMGSLQGQSFAANEQAIRQGGTVASPQLFLLDVKEVVRCTAVAIRRRTELMGPVCRHDQLTAQLLALLGSRPAPPNHWSQAWISCHLGLAYAAAGKTEQAATELTKSLVVGGQFDHQLTSQALLALGQLALDQGQNNAAADYFLEATFAAAAFDQFDVMQEAFEGGAVTHMIAGRPGLYAPLPQAAGWAQRQSRALQAQLLLLAAENYAQAGEAAQAFGVLAQARQAIGTRDMRNGRAGARFNYLSALVDFQQGNLASGIKSLGAALNFQKASSTWLMQIGLADALYVSGNVTQRLADDLYSELLREPTRRDWAVQPLETLSVVNTPHPGPLGRWFEVALLRKDQEKALEIGDRIRRHQFFSTLPMGGRLLSLRWIMEAPEALLSQTAVLQRQELLGRYPEYGRLAAQSAETQRQLRALPLAAQTADQRVQQTQLLEQLHKTSTAQELLLSNVALRREPSEFVFPPLLELKQIKERMKQGQLLLVYRFGDRSLTAFAIDKERIASWQVESPGTVPGRIADLLKLMQVDRKLPLQIADLGNDKWQQPSFELLQQLTNIRKPETWRAYKEVVIVPDGPLWYLPFEALYVAEGSQGRPLISQVPVRYAPTASLANLPGGGAKPQAATAVVAGKLFASQDPQLTAQAAQDIQAVLPGTARLDVLPGPSSLFAAVTDRLIVLNELDQTTNPPYGWSPMQLDRGKRGGDLESWLALPWQGPAEVILPSYRTSAESGLKGAASGAEIFLPVCGLMASGARSVLISRWNVGGQTTFDLIREFAQELPYTAPSLAWQRSVLLNARNPIEPALEPRVRVDGLLEEVRASHPFFWAGYLLVDCGTEPAPPAAGP